MIRTNLKCVLLAFGGAVALLAGHAAEAECDAQGVCTRGGPPLAVAGEGKMMWATSRLFEDGPPLEVGKWLKDKPELEGKFIVLEFWRTWCGACKRMTPLMNKLQERFGDELAVVGISGESEEALKKYNGPAKKYFLALDAAIPAAEREDAPKKADADANPQGPDIAAGPGVDLEQGKIEAFFEVWGWPHVVILEPQHRAVIWEGFSGQQGYELTEAKVERILKLGRAARKAAAEQKQKAQLQR